MPSPKELLTHFSLSPHEAELYLTALTLGSASVSELAKKTGKSRTAVYFHVNHLLQKGLFKETRKGKVVRYLPTPPRDLVERIDGFTTDLKSLLPLLESLHKVESEKPEISVMESKQGFYQIYDEISSMPQGSLLRVVEGEEAMAGELALLPQAHWQVFFQRIIQRRISTRAIFTESALELPRAKLNKANIDLLQQRLWDIRSIPTKTLPFQKLILLYGSTVAFLLPEASMVVRIRHTHISEMLQQLFDGLHAFGTVVPSPWTTQKQG